MSENIVLVLRFVCVVVFLLVPTLTAQETVLQADADTFTRGGVDAGSVEALDVRRLGEDDIVAYIRFDLSKLDADTVKSATLTLHKVGGLRNDTINNERHAVYGLTSQPDNTPQNWNESTMADQPFGLERRNRGVDPQRVFNLDADDGAKTSEDIKGDTVTLTGDDLVAFLNERMTDDKLATFIVMIKAADRGYGFASRENRDESPRPTLTVATGVPGPPKPTLWIIGDSTVRVGSPGQRGWGSEIDSFFDTDRINIDNRAMGGRSSRTFRTDGRWAEILTLAKPGDYVLMQFGHNDPAPLDDEQRARGTIRGIGEEAKGIYNPIRKENEIVHSYGWYMRLYVREAKANDITPIVLSYIPRAPATDKPVSEYKGPESYALWAKQVAEEEGAAFIDLYGRIWNAYEKMDPKQIRTDLFGEADSTHTSPEGAKFNARRVAEGIYDLEDVDLKNYLIETSIH